jgi:hypothetical protein
MIRSKLSNNSLTWPDKSFQYDIQQTFTHTFNSDELYYFPKLHPLSDQTSRATTQIWKPNVKTNTLYQWHVCNRRRYAELHRYNMY